MCLLVKQQLLENSAKAYNKFDCTMDHTQKSAKTKSPMGGATIFINHHHICQYNLNEIFNISLKIKTYYTHAFLSFPTSG